MHVHQHDTYHEASRITWITLGVNLVLGVGKVIAGVTGHSWAVIADGLHTMSDLVSSAAILVGLRVARRAPDESHPYGHGKAEGLAAMVVGFLLALLLSFGALSIFFFELFALASALCLERLQLLALGPLFRRTRIQISLACRIELCLLFTRLLFEDITACVGALAANFDIDGPRTALAAGQLQLTL